MKCLSYSESDFYKYKLAKTRQNVLKDIYKRCDDITLKSPYPKPKKSENARLKLRFKEAIRDAQEICTDEGVKSKQCHLAWYEVDELEDSMNRYYPDQED